MKFFVNRLKLLLQNISLLFRSPTWRRIRKREMIKTGEKCSSSTNLSGAKSNTTTPKTVAKHSKIILVAQKTEPVVSVVCDFCDEIFISPTRFDFHMEREHLKKTKWKCQFCLFCFESAEALIQHKMDVHKSEVIRCEMCKKRDENGESRSEIQLGVKFQCVLCKFVSNSRLELRRHAELHVARDIKCKGCGHMFHSLYKYKCHLKTECTNLKTTCTICNRQVLVQNVFKHQRSHEDTKANKEGRFTCNFCDKNFKKKQNLYSHRWNIHRRKKVTHEHEARVCLHCGKLFATRGYLKRHEKYHEQSPTMFTCAMCPGKSFLVYARYRKHKILMHDPSRCICFTCGKKFMSSALLKRHLAAHGDRKWICEKCGRAFRRQDNLHNHRLKVHEMVKTCKKCKLSFVSQEEFRSHMMSIHRKLIRIDCNFRSLVEGIGTDRFRCNICAKEFLSRNSAFSHTSVHRWEDVPMFAA